MNPLRNSLISCSALCACSSVALAADITYGIEALAHYRSTYNYRGFELAQDSLDLQLSTLYRFQPDTALSAAVWYATETGLGDFTEAGVFTEIRKDFEPLSIALSATYRSYQNSLFESGINLEFSARYPLRDTLELQSSIAYDTGAEAWYAATQLDYYWRINDDSFVTITAGCSAVQDYYSRDGLNDVFTKLSYTYNVNQSLSLSPYLASSSLIDSSNDQAKKSSIYGGIHLAVSF